MTRTVTEPTRGDAEDPPLLTAQQWQQQAPPAPVIGAPRRRSRGLIAIGVAVIALSGIAAVSLYDAATGLVPAVGVTARVPFGSVITEADLVQIQIHPDPAVAAVRWDQRDRLVGHQAATDLLPGAVVTAEAADDIAIPGSGQALVGIAVTTGQLPATPLGPRDKVLLVGTDGPTGQGTGEPGQVLSGTVARVGDLDPTTGGRTVDVEVPSQDAAGLAARAAAGRVAIVLQPRG